MAPTEKHKWKFISRFRRRVYGWDASGRAVKRIEEAIAEIKEVGRTDPVLAAEGAVRFLEKVSPALEHVDSSSGALGAMVYYAGAELALVIGNAPVSEPRRRKWLDRLWLAMEKDEIPYLEGLADQWGELCGSAEYASKLADEFIDAVRRAWDPDTDTDSYHNGAAACLSSLYKAGRFTDLFELLDLDPHKLWDTRIWGVKALAEQGKIEEAVRYAEDSLKRNLGLFHIAPMCEELLLSIGKWEEAYGRYAIPANQKSTYLGTFKAIAKKYPEVKPADILNDLVESLPGQEGKWYTAAKAAGLYDEAIELVNRTPCSHSTLIRGARDFCEKRPRFAMESGLVALKWLAAGHGYEVTVKDIEDAYKYTLAAAVHAGAQGEAKDRLRQIAGTAHPNSRVYKILRERLAGADPNNDRPGEKEAVR
ncbi:MAG: hypothetical protein KJ970_19305 [Candidatus Eisenbacteria bacterium]|uniref:Uncharacterized protein n=1 Tax=Eiseniibacteriota bacterium TaxID=2212470 RepID=A0A948W7X8_UNCEI|nr:hypothetical protein [Candidatus Eisenbacteria bacterium]MBU1949733.1 hypothetical protein [Candidatus Eisenbacteria bacterium]MBU2693069.1 hypothetical protein [Candidatus Eisenbacteria bacterium]